MTSIRLVNKGDIIVERVNGRKNMIPVSKVEFDACSSKGVHINSRMCYDSTAEVDLVLGEGTLADLKEATDELDDFDPGVQVSVGDVLDSHEELAERLIRV